MQKKEEKKEEKNKSAFSLVELIVVIAIIGILAGMILVSLKGIRENANNKAVLKMLKQAQSAALICMNENEPSALSIGTAPEVTSMCKNSSGIHYLDYSVFPYSKDLDGNETEDIYDKYKWVFSRWCLVGDNNPPTPCAPYLNGSCGGDYSKKQICFLYRNSDYSKHIWCTEDGCDRDF